MIFKILRHRERERETAEPIRDTYNNKNPKGGKKEKEKRGERGRERERGNGYPIITTIHKQHGYKYP